MNQDDEINALKAALKEKSELAADWEICARHLYDLVKGKFDCQADVDRAFELYHELKGKNQLNGKTINNFLTKT